MPECSVADCKSGRKKTARNPKPEILQTFPFPTETTARNRWLRQCSLGKDTKKGKAALSHFYETGYEIWAGFGAVLGNSYTTLV